MARVGIDAAGARGARGTRSKRASKERVWRPAAGVDARPTSRPTSVGDGITESRSKIVVRGAIRVACHGVDAMQEIDGKIQGTRHGGDAKAHPGSGLEKVGPSLAFLIRCHVELPVELRLQRAQQGCIAEAVLRVEQE